VNDLDLATDGLADRIHQPRRRDLYPRSMELVDSARELGALGATISGAGPAVLVWTTWQDAGKVTEALEGSCEDWAEVRRLPFTPHGADVPEL
jgi:homoserine kinase